MPVVRKYPRKISIGPNAKPKGKALGMIFLADVRKINVADLIFVVKIDEQFAVSDGDISHKAEPQKIGLRAFYPPVLKCRIHAARMSALQLFYCLLDGGVQLALNFGAEADDLCHHFAAAVKDHCLWNVVTSGKDKTD